MDVLVNTIFLHCLYLKSWHENTGSPRDDSHAHDDKEEPSPKEDSEEQTSPPGSRATWYDHPEPSPQEDGDVVDSDSDQMYENVKVGECSGHEICCICKIVHWF